MSQSFNRLLLSHWGVFIEKVGRSESKDKSAATGVNGHELDLATVVAVARCVFLYTLLCICLFYLLY